MKKAKILKKLKKISKILDNGTFYSRDIDDDSVLVAKVSAIEESHKEVSDLISALLKEGEKNDKN